MSQVKYTIAVVCKTHIQFRFLMRENFIYQHMGSFINGEFEYICVNSEDKLRGRQFNGLMIYGDWKDNPHTRNEEYHKIMQYINVCFRI